jgi:vacuolar-type H+-ATPase subunit H
VSDLGKAEILHEIKITEEKVRLMVKEAEEKRKQLQAEGKRMAIQKIDSSDAVLRREHDSKVAEARSKIDNRKRSLQEDGTRKAATLTSGARKRTGQAKEFVLSEFERAIDA